MVQVLSDWFELHTEYKKYFLVGINIIKQFCCIKRKFSSLRAGK